MGASFEFDDLDRLTAGTVGPAGERIFYIQATSGAEVVSLKLEKQQVVALANYLEGVLEGLDNPTEPGEAAELIEPVIAEWTVGNIGVAYLETQDQIVLWAEEVDGADDSDAENGTARFRVSRPLVAAFIGQARALAVAGRPPCSWCGSPLNSSDGWCGCHN